MTPEQFVYWLQGFAEVNQKAPNDAQWTVIKDHLQLVFKKETPNRMPYPLGPAVAEPAKPPLNPPYTWPSITPLTTPNYPRPEIICSVNGITPTGFSPIPKGSLNDYN